MAKHTEKPTRMDGNMSNPQKHYIQLIMNTILQIKPAKIVFKVNETKDYNLSYYTKNVDIYI